MGTEWNWTACINFLAIDSNNRWLSLVITFDLIIVGGLDCTPSIDPQGLGGCSVSMFELFLDYLSMFGVLGPLVDGPIAQ